MASDELLSTHAFFAGLDPQALLTIAGLAEERHYEPGQALFYEGAPADHLCAVLDGEAALYHTVIAPGAARQRSLEALATLMDEGTAIPMLEGGADVYAEALVGRVPAGEIAGLSALVAPYVFTATARAAAATRALRIDAVALRAECERDARMAATLLHATAKTAFERLHFARVRALAAG
jgi:CRP-like cAMP-binding protein